MEAVVDHDESPAVSSFDGAAVAAAVDVEAGAAAPVLRDEV